ncbi:hypothetical protein FEF22_001435 [Texas Phoenix palm phytoplasma]|uniref:Effector n=1 Tax=Texas Phoenix palm phytoplasma TaxID=176709 RepID=A0ABS5BHZ9_9MOLU|nr:hypothetical protein [Texas Phoenix palm phytoplasma]MBP3059207.1 hypothetical protein [Texas Phoenix palm phytoplasma]MBP3059446.1 hypothetical protein [Texas Phoenix palm phytoplasma]
MLKKDLLLNKKGKLNYFSFVSIFFLFFYSMIISSLTPNVVLAFSDDSNHSENNINAGISETKESYREENKNNSIKEIEERKLNKNPLVVAEQSIQNIIQNEQTEDQNKFVSSFLETKSALNSENQVEETIEAVFQSCFESLESKTVLATSATMQELTNLVKKEYPDKSHKRAINYTSSYIIDEILDVKRWGYIKVDRFPKGTYDYDEFKDVIKDTLNGIFKTTITLSKSELGSEYQYIIDFFENHMKSEISSVVNSLWFK